MTGYIPASATLPDGHKSIAVFATEDEAVSYARELLRRDHSHRYYLMDKRGAWEVIRY